MNCIFLVIPLVGNDTAGNEAVYLKGVEGNNHTVAFENLIKKTVQTLKFVKEENFVVYYDHRLFQELYSKAKKNRIKDRPGSVALLNMMPSMKPIEKLGSMNPITVNEVAQNHGILCAFVNYSNVDSDVMLDPDAFINPRAMRVADSEGRNFVPSIVPCNADELFKWFVGHRTPRRTLTEGYEKHTEKEKEVNGVKVSALSYSHQEAEHLLHWAIGEKTHNRRYFMDLKKERLLIFWNQNESIPTFHAYDVELDNSVEIQKMWKECGREIVRKIEKIANLIHV